MEPFTAAERGGCAVSCRRLGVPEAERAHIFEPFYRARNVEGLEGSGLGLYLSRQLVERHGGRLWLEQSDDTGSTFAFTLPLAD